MSEGFANEWEEMREEEFEAFGDVTQVSAYDEEAPQAEIQPVEVEPEPEIPAAERLAALVDKLPGQTKTLVRIISACTAPVAASDAIAAIAEWQKFNYSVYAPTTLCSLLENAGGIERVNQDGSPFVEEEEAGQPESDQVEPCAAEAEADSEEEFDDTVAEPDAPTPVYWRATSAGLELVDKLDPRKKVAAMLDDEAFYLPVYKELLEKLADGPMAKADVDVIVKASPLTQEPMRLGGYFIDRLERIEAIEWSGAWQITDIGRELLDNEALY